MPRAVTFIIALLSVITTAPKCHAQPLAADVLLKGGHVHDGSGAASNVADVAIRGDKIIAMGDLREVKAEWVIDCRGLVVCPGFIDLHNHSDFQIVQPATRSNLNFVMQGCTTVVTGNCGSGPVNAKEYYDAIESHGAGTNVAHLLPQGSLRQQVMETALRKPTADELARLLELADKAMRDGAWGMSTGLIYVPSSYADTDEIAEIAKVIGKHGGIYASHIRGEGSELMKSIDEALEIGRRGGASVHISHFKSSGEENWGLVRQAVKQINAAHATGQVVTADQYPYHASSTSLDATLLPTWALEGGRAALLKRFNDPEQGPRIRAYVEDSLKTKRQGEVLRIARYAPRPEWAGKNLVELAALEKLPPIDVAYQIFKNGGAQIVNFGMSPEDVEMLMAIDWVATASDGRATLPGGDRPHPRSFGTFSRKIGHFAIEKKVVSLEHAIRSSTSLPAKILGMTDRGTLKVGAFADIVVLAPTEFRDTATFEEPHRYSRGLRFVFVNGRPAVADGAPTGGLFGRALRRLP